MRIRGLDADNKILSGMEVRVSSREGKFYVSGKTTRGLQLHSNGVSFTDLLQLLHRTPASFNFNPPPGVDPLLVEVSYCGESMKEEIKPSKSFCFRSPKTFPRQTHNRWVWPSVGVALLILVVITAVLHRADRGEDARSFNEKHAWVKTSTSRPKNLVVFVHGIFGSGETWTSSPGVSLPKLMAADPVISPLTDILVFEYDSPKLGNAGKITEISENLDQYLQHENVWKEFDKIIFVGHSMGGLVIRQLLADHRDHAAQVSMLYLYATPTDGADVASLASRISPNSALRGMFPLNINEFLNALRIAWNSDAQLSNIPTYCAYEGQDTDGVRVVSQSSASALCKDSQMLNYNHEEIVKPVNRDDPRYYYSQLKVSAALRAAGQPK
jgi:pimeloyl-ACP methyl ester carboxylesterase